MFFDWLNLLRRILQNRIFPNPPVPDPTPIPPPPIDPTIPAPPIDDSDVLQEMLDRVNAEREKRRLRPFTVDSCLQIQIDEHCANMRRFRRLSHDGLADRLRSCSVSIVDGSENVARGQRSASEAVGDWMTSRGHRANILSQVWTHIGCGNDGKYWGLLFARKKD